MSLKEGFEEYVDLDSVIEKLKDEIYALYNNKYIKHSWAGRIPIRETIKKELSNFHITSHRDVFYNIEEFERWLQTCKEKAKDYPEHTIEICNTMYEGLVAYAIYYETKEEYIKRLVGEKKLLEEKLVGFEDKIQSQIKFLQELITND